jgi:chitin disaccharide deacetylase
VMGPQRLLVVNADDLGHSDGVNAGIFEAHTRGIVTSASVMVRRSAVGEAARLSTRHPALALGLHIDIGQWDYENGEWKLAYAHCPPDDEAAVASECASQLEAFRALLGRDPTHLDSHQHAHRTEPVASVAARMAKDLEVPLRGVGIRYEGGFYGQTGKGEPYADGISLERLLGLIRLLPPGWTELGCHPGIGVEETQSSYAHEREQELQALCDFRVKSVLEVEEVQLRSFAEAT